MSLIEAYKSMREKCKKSKKNKVDQANEGGEKSEIENKDNSVQEKTNLTDGSGGLNGQNLVSLAISNKSRRIKTGQNSKIDKSLFQSTKGKSNILKDGNGTIKKPNFERQLRRDDVQIDESQAGLNNQRIDMNDQISESGLDRLQKPKGMKKSLGRRMKAKNSLRKVL